MIDFDEVLKNANKKYKDFLVYTARTPNSNPKVSGEVEAMGKAIVEAINNELNQHNRIVTDHEGKDLENG